MTFELVVGMNKDGFALRAWSGSKKTRYYMLFCGAHTQYTYHQVHLQVGSCTHTIHSSPGTPTGRVMGTHNTHITRYTYR